MAVGKSPVRRAAGPGKAAVAPRGRGSPVRNAKGLPPAKETPRAVDRYRKTAEEAYKASPGVAVVSADWLLQLRDEVEGVAGSPKKLRPVPDTASPPPRPTAEAQQQPPAQQRPARDAKNRSPPRGPGGQLLTDAKNKQPSGPSRASPSRSIAVGSSAPLDRDVAVGTTAPLVEVLQNAVVGLHDRSVSPERLKTQSTQTQTQTAAAETVVEPTAAVRKEASPYSARGRSPLKSPLASPTMAPRESPQSGGRCDLFGHDTFHADQQKERRIMQAQLLEEQIAEQRQRKEDEKRRRKEEELEDIRRVEREQRELQEQHAREQRKRAAPAEPGAALPVEQAALAQERNSPQQKRSLFHGVASQGATAAEESSAGPWAADANGTARRRRRRRKTNDQSPTKYTQSTWRSQADPSWHDTNAESIVGNRTPDRCNSQSPPPWMSETDARSAVRETARDKSVEARQRRTRERKRERIRERDRDRDDRTGDQRDRYERSYGETPDDTRASNWHHGEEPRRRRRPPPPEGPGGHHQIDDVAPGPGRQFVGRAPPAMSNDDLRQQLGSLVTLCEQLLVERADRERAERERLERESGIVGRAGSRRPELPVAASPSGGRQSGRGHHVDIGNLPAIGNMGYGGGYEVPDDRPLQNHVPLHSGREPSIHSGRDHSGRERTGKERSGRERSGREHSGRDHGGREDHRAQEHLAGEENSMHGDVAPGYANRGHASPAARGTGRALPPPMPTAANGGGEIMPSNDWPPDALSSLLAQANVQPSGPIDASTAPRLPPYGLRDIEEQPDPFAAPGRGMSVRRVSNGNVGYGAHLLMSPPPVGNGLNLQANWPAFGRSGPTDEYSGVFAPSSAGLGGGFPGPSGFSAGLGMGPELKTGPGHIPIGIRPSIQAQSAMLRELYPHGPLAAGPAAPLPTP